MVSILHKIFKETIHLLKKNRRIIKECYFLQKNLTATLILVEYQ